MASPHDVPAGASTPSRLLALAIVPLVLGLLCVHLLVWGPLPWTATVAWAPSLGVSLDINIDGLALQFLLLITGIGTLVFMYAAAYMSSDPNRVRLYVLLLAFMAAMVGCVIVDNLLALFCFWELTSLTSFLLVGYTHESDLSRRAAQQALLVTGGGGLVLLAGIVLLGEIAGTYSLQRVIAASPVLVDDARLLPALLCIFVGAFTKSAQWPFHFWLPNAMAAPTPVSAYLHSATMVKLGIYLLARLDPAFGRLLFWEMTLVSVGAVTAVWAMALVLRERDLKRILAWSTVSALGTLVVLIGLPGSGAATATAAFLLAHALYKAPLFFVAGNIDHCTGSRDIDRLAGLGRVMPGTAAAAVLAGVSMAGVPLSFGYVAKDFIAIAKSEGEVMAWAGYSILLVSAVTVAVAGVATIRLFWHRGGGLVPDDIHRAPALMVAAPLMAAGCGAVFGVVPTLTEDLIWASALAMGATIAPDALREAPSSDKITAAAVIVTGLLIFIWWDRLRLLMDRTRPADRFGPARLYAHLLQAVPRAASLSTPRLQNGSLTSYLALSVGFVAGATMLAWWHAHAGAPEWPAWSAPAPAAFGATAAIVASAVAVCIVRDRFVMMLASGLVGLGSALLFLFLGAPDLSLTQFSVEVAFVVVVASVILRVGQLELAPVVDDRRAARVVLALAVGGVVSALLLACTAGPLDPAVARYFGEQSVAAAHGRNVVNVVIVDFRALDTLGEIAVVAVTFLAALPLLQRLRGGQGRQGDSR